MILRIGMPTVSGGESTVLYTNFLYVNMQDWYCVDVYVAESPNVRDL